MAPRKSILTSFVAFADDNVGIDGCSAITFFDIDTDIGGMAWNNFSGVLSDDAKEKSAESPRTLSKSLKKWEVDDEESWLTPECVAGGGRVAEVVTVVAVGGFSISGWLRLTGDRLRMGWWSVKVTLVLVSMSAWIVSWSIRPPPLLFMVKDIRSSGIDGFDDFSTHVARDSSPEMAVVRGLGELGMLWYCLFIESIMEQSG